MIFRLLLLLNKYLHFKLKVYNFILYLLHITKKSVFI
jgi:hypothetical protein